MRVSRSLPTFLVGALAIHFLAAGCSAKGVDNPSFDPPPPPPLDASLADVPDTNPPPLGSDKDANGPSGPVIVDSGGVTNDAELPDAQGCVPDAGPIVAPIHRNCLAPTQNECDGTHDLPTYPLNGTTGNGFDDDCDGLVDEGCSCPAAGLTKDCYLVPASQTYGGKPVGWCAENSKGSVDCVKPSSEFAGHWSGQCRGAQPPFADDICAAGDFNCDGADQNSKTQDCSCKAGLVQCPTTPLQTVPYPPPGALPLKVDATPWFLVPSDVTKATNWQWTMRGGDCDNILPHPSFAIYPTASGTGAPVGTQKKNLGTSGQEQGWQAGTAEGVTSSFYPAFSLSGDYIVQSDFDLYGQHYSCSQKIQVRAPGIRAEACWDTVGNVDIDLHMAKLDHATCAQKGWSDTCAQQDCYYANCKSASFGSKPNWFADSPSSSCVGWGSAASGACGNPRLDRDNISCDTSEVNPNKTGSSGQFCGSENINVDAPTDGTKYAVGVKYYGGSSSSKPHVNVYCNGERVLSTGFNPITGNNFPVMNTSGGDSSGDFWKVAFITANLQNGKVNCDVVPTQSQHANPALDGSNAYCVDNSDKNGSDSMKFFASGGASPLNADALCFH